MTISVQNIEWASNVTPVRLLLVIVITSINIGSQERGCLTLRLRTFRHQDTTTKTPPAFHPCLHLHLLHLRWLHLLHQLHLLRPLRPLRLLCLLHLHLLHLLHLHLPG